MLFMTGCACVLCVVDHVFFLVMTLDGIMLYFTSAATIGQLEDKGAERKRESKK
jgi:hypothetical protein